MSKQELIDRLRVVFEQTYNTAPDVCGIAPGRVEVLGNHTDYNDGFILSAAIDRYIAMCARRRNDRKVTLYSAQFDCMTSFSLDAITPDADASWANYIKGVLAEMIHAGNAPCGFDAVVGGTVPLGAGLSSSAALEVATLFTQNGLLETQLTGPDAAKLCQRAENNFVGVQCGILDQFSSVMGKENHLIVLDCRDVSSCRHVPLGDDASLVLADTKAPHSLADGTYNRLREECFAAATFFNDHLAKDVTHLRDVTPTEFAAYERELPPELAARARHVITENARVLEGIASLERHDLVTMGHCMMESHASSRDDFGNSCMELDTMVRCALNFPGFLGARLSGGGFGGCTVNLVESDHAAEFAEVLAERYQVDTGITPEVHLCQAGHGAETVTF